MPFMINRMILSLKKAGNSLDSGRSPSGVGRPGSTKFARCTIGGSERAGGGIPLRNPTSGRVVCHRVMTSHYGTLRAYCLPQPCGFRMYPHDPP